MAIYQRLLNFHFITHIALVSRVNRKVLLLRRTKNKFPLFNF